MHSEFVDGFKTKQLSMGTVSLQEEVSINRGPTVELILNQSQELHLVLIALVRLSKILRTLKNF